MAVLMLTGCAESHLPNVADTPEVPAAVSTATAPAGVSAPTDADINVDKLPAFYQQAIKKIPHPLPNGVAWPAKVPPGFDDPNVHYDSAGRGEAVASTYWLCAWQGEYLDAFESSEQKRQAEALTMLDAFVVDPFFTQVFVDPGQGWKRDVLDPAKNGDTWRMKSQHSDCPAVE
ncbi:hypothetical protein [Arthrobacter sp. Bi26]|uniref:hypothetical protein n=1 Tax=Arthrobacter sp. Bi26 TaxID=2822350 RepID=UPI001E4B7D0B|nr:hypothetical protein [Arthrobacter sp. Bi26]